MLGMSIVATCCKHKWTLGVINWTVVGQLTTCDGRQLVYHTDRSNHVYLYNTIVSRGFICES